MLVVTEIVGPTDCQRKQKDAQRNMFLQTILIYSNQVNEDKHTLNSCELMQSSTIHNTFKLLSWHDSVRQLPSANLARMN